MAASLAASSALVPSVRVEMERLRTLSEVECYERCYGWRWSEETVKVLRDEPDPRAELSDMGEKLRRVLELRLDAREPEPA